MGIGEKKKSNALNIKVIKAIIIVKLMFHQT